MPNYILAPQSARGHKLTQHSKEELGQWRRPPLRPVCPGRYHSRTQDQDGKRVTAMRALVLLLCLLCSLQLQLVASVEIVDDDDFVEPGSSSFYLPVTPPAVPEPVEERLDHYRAMAAKDLLRHRQMISSRNKRRQARESSSKLPEVMSDTSMFELPMRSAINIAHVGMYLVSVRFGTPALPYNLALDTATDLTWINCRLRRRGGKHYGRPRVKRAPTVSVLSMDGESAPVKVIKNWYRPARSSSWRRIRCSQQECAELPYNQCQSPNQTASCSYYQVVQDGTTTSGIYGKEKATVALSCGRMAKLPGLILGCSTFEAGGSVDAHDGVLALGNSGISFGIHAAKRFSGRFSFCLLSTHSARNVSSYLTFGSNPAVNAPGTMETPLKYHPDMEVAYGARVTCITVAGELLDIPPEVWDDAVVGAGMILDTGTSLTGLAPPAYAAVTKALDRHLAHLQRVTDIAGFEFCYSWTFTGDGVDPAHNVTVPRFTVELEGGARLEPDAKSVVMPEVVPGVACLAFRKLETGPGIIGNVLMQEHIWEFDHMGERIRFRKDKCTDHNSKHTNTAPAA